MPRIENASSHTFNSEAQPEPLDACGIGYLDTATKPIYNWWYADTSLTATAPLPPVPPVAIDTQTITAPYVPSTKGLTEYISSLWSMLWRPGDASKPINAPALSPEQVDEKTLKLFTDALAEMQKTIQELDEEYKQFLNDDPAKAEAAIYKVLALLMKNQLKVNEEKALLTTRRVTDGQKRVKEINEEHNKISDEKETLSKNESRAKTVATFVGAAAGLAAFATLAVATGGTILAATPMGIANISAATTVIAGIATTGLNVASGAALILKEYLAGKVKDATQSSIILQLNKELESEGINKDIKKVKDALEDIANYWSLMKDVAENHNQASKYILRR